MARVPVSKTGGWGFESLLPCGLRFAHDMKCVDVVMRTPTAELAIRPTRGCVDIDGD